MKRVTAAYHTICEPCTRQSSKAKKLLEEWNTVGPPTTSTVAENDPYENTKEEGVEENDKNESKEQPVDDEKTDANGNNDGDDDDVPPDDADDDEASAAEPRRLYRRICAMCVKEPALAGESDQDDDDEMDERLRNLDRPLRLRERKRLERMAEKKSSRRRNREHQEEIPPTEEAEGKEVPDDDTEEEEEDQDPLLQAVGGADKLLTGEAYQAHLLQKQQQISQT